MVRYEADEQVCELLLYHTKNRESCDVDRLFLPFNQKANKKGHST